MNYYQPEPADRGGSNLGGVLVLALILAVAYYLVPQYQNPPEPTTTRSCVWHVPGACLASADMEIGSGRFLDRKNGFHFEHPENWRDLDPAAGVMLPEFFEPLRLTGQEKTDLAAIWKRDQMAENLDIAGLLEYQKAPDLLSFLSR